ncbi:hypothetical protein ACI0X9_003276 [Cronobacter turicensis]
MQPSDYKNPFIRNTANKVRESHNLIFMLTTRAKELDKHITFNETGKKLMGWPDHIDNMYEYRMMWGVDYNRLYHMCIISLCSELEFFFKSLWEKYSHLPGNKKNNFFQRFDDVIADLQSTGINFSPIQGAVDTVSAAFQVRHIGIHNMSIVDASFQTKTKGLGTLGQYFTVDQTLVNSIFDATEELMKHLDVNLPPLPATSV